MQNLNYKNIDIESCLESDEDALWLKMKEESEKKRKLNLQPQKTNVCPFEEFEDLTEAEILKNKK